MRALKVSVLLFFLSYTVIQAAGKNFSPMSEYFPVFSWSLFSEVRNDTAILLIEIKRVGEVEYDVPRNYYELPEISQYSESRSTSPYKAAIRLANARNDPEIFELRLQDFNAAYFDVKDEVEFQLTLQRFAPLEKWHSGTVKDRHVLVEDLLKEQG